MKARLRLDKCWGEGRRGRRPANAMEPSRVFSWRVWRTLGGLGVWRKTSPEQWCSMIVDVVRFGRFDGTPETIRGRERLFVR